MLGLATIPPSEYFVTDPQKLGWIKVKYRHEVLWAKPCFQLGSFAVPTAEWVDAYGSSVYVLVDTIEGSDDLVWVGFMFHTDATPDETVANYPYTKVFFTENWKLEVNDTPGELSLSLTRGDGKLTITANDSEFRLTSNVGNVVIDSANVHLGETGGEFVVMGQRLIDAFAAHKHIGNMGAPTSTPYPKYTKAGIGSYAVNVQR